MPKLDIIKNARSILLITEKYPDIATILCCDVLLGIMRREGIRINWFIDPTQLSSNFRAILPAKEDCFINTFDSSEYYVDIKPESGITDINKFQLDSATRLVFKTKEGIVDKETLELERMEVEFDAYIFFTNKKISRILGEPEIKKRVEQQEKTFFVQESELDAIGLKVSQLIFGIMIQPAEATILLTAILWEAANKNSIEIFEVINKLTFRYKADFAKSVEVMNSYEDGDVTSWTNKILKYLQIRDGVKYAYVKSNKLTCSKLKQLSAEKKFPIKISQNDKGVIILTRCSDGEVVFATGEVVLKFLELVTPDMYINDGIVSFTTSERIGFLEKIGVYSEKTVDAGQIKNNNIELKEMVKKLDPEPKKVSEPQAVTLVPDEKPIKRDKPKTIERSTSVLSHQKAKKISVVNTTSHSKHKPQSFDPLPPANW